MRPYFNWHVDWKIVLSLSLSHDVLNIVPRDDRKYGRNVWHELKFNYKDSAVINELHITFLFARDSVVVTGIWYITEYCNRADDLFIDSKLFLIPLKLTALARNGLLLGTLKIHKNNITNISAFCQPQEQLLKRATAHLASLETCHLCQYSLPFANQKKT